MVCTLAGTSLPVYQWVMEMEEPYLRNSSILQRNYTAETIGLFRCRTYAHKSRMSRHCFPCCRRPSVRHRQPRADRQRRDPIDRIAARAPIRSSLRRGARACAGAIRPGAGRIVAPGSSCPRSTRIVQRKRRPTSKVESMTVLRARRGGTSWKWATLRGGVRRAIPFLLVGSGCGARGPRSSIGCGQNGPAACGQRSHRRQSVALRTSLPSARRVPPIFCVITGLSRARNPLTKV
jgi:hypothetical protein